MNFSCRSKSDFLKIEFILRRPDVRDAALCSKEAMEAKTKTTTKKVMGDQVGHRDQDLSVVSDRVTRP